MTTPVIAFRLGDDSTQRSPRRPQRRPEVPPIHTSILPTDLRARTAIRASTIVTSLMLESPSAYMPALSHVRDNISAVGRHLAAPHGADHEPRDVQPGCVTGLYHIFFSNVGAALLSPSVTTAG